MNCKCAINGTRPQVESLFYGSKHQYGAQYSKCAVVHRLDATNIYKLIKNTAAALDTLLATFDINLEFDWPD